MVSAKGEELKEYLNTEVSHWTYYSGATELG